MPRLFLAGASGVIGRRLAPLLVADGWQVAGLTRTSEHASILESLGVEPVVADVFDADALHAALDRARPEVVMHQLTDLPRDLDPEKMDEARARNARIRDVGTRNLIAAAVSCGAKRVVAQSIAFAYAPGPTPHSEEARLDIDAQGSAGVSARGVASLERQVLTAPFHGIVLRYGRLYGPGTSAAMPSGLEPIHVDAAARAAQLAASRGPSGIYNIAEEAGGVASQRARHLLGWDDEWRNNVR